MPHSIRPVLPSVIFNSSAIFVIQKDSKDVTLGGCFHLKNTWNTPQRSSNSNLNNCFYGVVMSFYYLQVLAASFITVWTVFFFHNPKENDYQILFELPAGFWQTGSNLIPVWSMHLQRETTAKCRKSLTLLPHRVLVNSMQSQILL